MSASHQPEMPAEVVPAPTPVLPALSIPVRDVSRRDFVRLRETETVAQALARLRLENIGDQVVYFYVTDRDEKLVGVVPTRKLLLSSASTLASEVMVSPAVSVRESEPLQDALRTLIERRLLALPVVDDSGRLTGMLDISDFTQSIIDFERRESAEEVFQLLGVHIDRERTRSTFGIIRSRFPWLLSNILAGLVAAFISNRFDNLLRSVVALAFFVPLVLSLAESIAMQSVTMSLDQMQTPAAGSRRRGMFREMRVGVLLGLISGLIVGLIGLTWLGLFKVAAVVAGGILIAGTIGATMGYFVPRLVRRWKLDPMVASGPVALALSDAASLACYFTLSSLVLT